MSESILDKVLDSQKEQEQANFDPSEMLAQLFKALSSKDEDVLRRRHGLHGGRKETLESIGKLYRVTRERIRQIESLAVKKIKSHSTFSDTLKPARHTILRVLREEGGGIMEQEYLLKRLLNFTPKADENVKSMLFLLEHLLDDVDRVGPSEHIKRSWMLKTTHHESAQEALRIVRLIVEDHGQPVTIAELWEKFRNHEQAKLYAGSMDQEMLSSHIAMSQHVDRNPFDEYGLVSWGTIVPKRMNDKIYLILKKSGKPLHFHEITERINSAKFDQRIAYPPTVHNELILNDRYVLVGRGVYALTEWGYKRGVVADVIRELLEKSPEGLSREEITKRVLEQRMVKKNTIYLALTNRGVFKKQGDRYVLSMV